MKINQDTISVVDFLDEYSNGHLRKRKDVEVLFEAGASYGLGEIISDLIYDFSSLWYTHKILSSESEENLNSVKLEFDALTKKISEYLQQIFSVIDSPELTKRFNEIYLQQTAGSVKNLIDLAHDFAKFKDMQNQIKRSKG